MNRIFAKLGCLFLLASSCLSTSWAKVLEEISKLAFGKKGKVHRSGSFAILSDEPRLKPEETFAELDRMLKMFLADFPGVKAPAQPVPLLIFSTQARYRAFWGRVVQKVQFPRPGPHQRGLRHGWYRRFLL